MDEIEEIKQRKVRALEEKIKASNWPDTPVKVTDATFGETVQKYPFVVVDCWAEWCGPCRMIGPIVEQLAKERQGEIVFAKLNVDENPATATMFGITGIPTLLVFKNGELVGQIVGAMPKPMLEAKINQYK